MYMYMYISKTRERVPAQDLVAFIFSNKTWKNAIFSTSREPARYKTTHYDAEQVGHISGEAEYIHVGAPRRLEACQVPLDTSETEETRSTKWRFSFIYFTLKS